MEALSILESKVDQEKDDYEGREDEVDDACYVESLLKHMGRREEARVDLVLAVKQSLDHTVPYAPLHREGEGPWSHQFGHQRVLNVEGSLQWPVEESDHVVILAHDARDNVMLVVVMTDKLIWITPLQLYEPV